MMGGDKLIILSWAIFGYLLFYLHDKILQTM